MKRKCPQTLDKPLLLFGLEVEDIGLLSFVGGFGSILFGPMIPGVCAIASWFLLMEFKKDKPSGYLIHWMYNQGMEFPGLIPPIKKVKQYSIYGTTVDVKKFSLR